MMVALSSLVGKNWLWNWRRRGTNGSSPRTPRRGWLLMVSVLPNGLTRHTVEELSRQKDEPEWMLQRRLQAWESYERMETPLGRRGDMGTLRQFSNFKFQQLMPYVPPGRDAINLVPTIDVPPGRDAKELKG